MQCVWKRTWTQCPIARGSLDHLHGTVFWVVSGRLSCLWPDLTWLRPCLAVMCISQPRRIPVRRFLGVGRTYYVLAAPSSLVAAATSLQSCPTLCNPIDSSPPGSAIPGVPQARTLEWVAISFSNTWKWKVKLLSRIRLLATPLDCGPPGSCTHGIFQAPSSLTPSLSGVPSLHMCQAGKSPWPQETKLWSLCLLPSQGLMLLLVSYLEVLAGDWLQLLSLGSICLLCY